MVHPYRSIGLLLSSLIVTLAACAPPSDEGPVPDRASVAAELQHVMEAYGSAFENRDVRALLGFYAGESEFHGYTDGRPTALADVREGLSSFLRTVDSVVVRYDTIDARPIAANIGVIYTRLSERWVDSTGVETKVGVSGSWLVRRVDGRWRIGYFDLKPVPPPP